METLLKNIAVPSGEGRSIQGLPEETVNASPDFDAVVIGAGFSGMHMPIYRRQTSRDFQVWNGLGVLVVGAIVGFYVTAAENVKRVFYSRVKF